MEFGSFTTTTPFGSVDGQEWPSEYRCWEIEGERGEFRQYEVDDTPPSPPHAARLRHGQSGGWGTTHWMRIEGNHFVECECIRGQPGKQPDKCDTRPCFVGDQILGGPSHGRQCPVLNISVETDSDGKERTYFERITKCTPKQTCGPRTWTYSTGSVEHHCDDYAKCCFAGTVRVDKDSWFSSEPCYVGARQLPLHGLFSGITHSGWCGDYVKDFLRNNPVNPRCDMDVNCSDRNSEPNENEDIKCDFEFYQGHPND